MAYSAGASKAIGTRGRSLWNPPPLGSPVQFISSVLPQIKNHLCQCHFHYEPIAGTARGAKQLLSRKTNKQHNTTEPPHGGSLEMDYLSLNTHTPFSISLFSSQHLLFCDPNYKSQLEGER